MWRWNQGCAHRHLCLGGLGITPGVGATSPHGELIRACLDVDRLLGENRVAADFGIARSPGGAMAMLLPALRDDQPPLFSNEGLVTSRSVEVAGNTITKRNVHSVHICLGPSYCIV